MGEGESRKDAGAPLEPELEANAWLWLREAAMRSLAVGAMISASMWACFLYVVIRRPYPELSWEVLVPLAVAALLGMIFGTMAAPVTWLELRARERLPSTGGIFATAALAWACASAWTATLILQLVYAVGMLKAKGSPVDALGEVVDFLRAVAREPWLLAFLGICAAPFPPLVAARLTGESAAGQHVWTLVLGGFIGFVCFLVLTTGTHVGRASEVAVFFSFFGLNYAALPYAIRRGAEAARRRTERLARKRALEA